MKLRVEEKNPPSSNSHSPAIQLVVGLFSNLTVRYTRVHLWLQELATLEVSWAKHLPSWRTHRDPRATLATDPGTIPNFLQTNRNQAWVSHRGAEPDSRMTHGRSQPGLFNFSTINILNQIILSCRAVLCTIECLADSLAFAH